MSQGLRDAFDCIQRYNRDVLLLDRVLLVLIGTIIGVILSKVVL